MTAQKTASKRDAASTANLARLMSGSGAKPTSFRASSRRLMAMLRPERGLVYTVLALGTSSVTLAVLGPKILGNATDLVVAGVVGRSMPAGLTKDQALQQLAQHGRGGIADMLRSTDFVPGEGIHFQALGTVLLIVLALYVAAGTVSIIQNRLATRVIQQAVYRLRDDVEAKLSRLPLSYFDGTSRGEVLSRTTNDIDNVQLVMQQTMGQMVNSLLTLVGVFAMMLWISPLLALVAVVTVPVSLYAASRVAKRSQGEFVQQWRFTGQLNGHIEEMYTGHAVVKVYGQEEQSAATFHEHNEALYRSSRKAQAMSGIIQPTMVFMGNLNYVLVAVIGGLRIAAGALSIGEVQAFIQYSRLFSQPLTQISSMANLLQSGVASAERVFELLDTAEQQPDPVPGARPLEVHGRVAFENVSFRYSADKPLITDLSLMVEPGQTVAIVGPTGAGKTTLVNLLMRFYELDSGRITLDGVDIAAMSRQELRSHIGMVLQDTWLFGGTIADNIAYGHEGATREQVMQAALLAHADRFIRTLPDGYDTLIGDSGTELSAGEKQLITIARAFLSDPGILILDEATSSVDTRTEMLIQQAMIRLSRDRTSFIIAHRLSTIRDADVILVMESGAIVEQGSHEELLRADGAYSRLYNAQFAASTTG